MFTIAHIAELVHVTVRGDTSRLVAGVASLSDAAVDQLSFITSDQFLDAYAATRAAAVLVSRQVALPAEPNAAGTVVLVVDDAELAMVEVLNAFAPPVPRPPPGIDPFARIAPDAVLGEACCIGPFVSIGQRTRLGRGCILHAGVFVGDDVVMGDDCQLFPNAVIRERIRIGHRVIVHAGAVIGTDGFGYRWNGSRHAKIPQIGTVVIEDDVEIGSCACVDRAKFAATVIGRGTKIDNQVQVAHNVRIGPHCILAGQAGIAGSSTLGAGVVLGGRAGVRDNVSIGDGTFVAGNSAVLTNQKAHTTISGSPAAPHRQSLREQAATRRLPGLLNEVKKLQAEIEELRKHLTE